VNAGIVPENSLLSTSLDNKAHKIPRLVHKSVNLTPQYPRLKVE
jgi:hypothetical protein